MPYMFIFPIVTIIGVIVLWNTFGNSNNTQEFNDSLVLGYYFFCNYQETTEERSRKQAKLEYTYQQILATQAEQVNNKANLHNTNTKMAENMLESTNILDFDKIAKKA